MAKYFHTNVNNGKFWISFDIDGVDASEFEATGTTEENGLSLDFVQAFFSRWSKRSVGMDFTEVNFELATSELSRQADE